MERLITRKPRRTFGILRTKDVTYPRTPKAWCLYYAALGQHERCDLHKES